MMVKCRWGLFGCKGIISSHLGSLLACFKPGFHPWQQEAIRNHDAWVEAYERTGDPMIAGAALYQAAR